MIKYIVSKEYGDKTIYMVVKEVEGNELYKDIKFKAGNDKEFNIESFQKECNEYDLYIDKHLDEQSFNKAIESLKEMNAIEVSNI